MTEPEPRISRALDNRVLLKWRLQPIHRLQRMARAADDVAAYQVLQRLWWREYQDYNNGRGVYHWSDPYPDNF